MKSIRGPLAYVLALVATFAIAFGAGRAWGPEPEPTSHDAPTHSVVGEHDTYTPDSTTPGTPQHEGGHR